MGMAMAMAMIMLVAVAVAMAIAMVMTVFCKLIDHTVQEEHTDEIQAKAHATHDQDELGGFNLLYTVSITDSYIGRRYTHLAKK
ncbi:hypothetical protein PENSUB_11039 [Penicillium subrubescens]|uniref:Uncharacterized protein n=1 Tax=Penicillium subrubescens TaxID=1316194 RepID=A0A1Q5T5L3_9EURO|nr:hypothetical protein PENSUB_11039 [Penicillium subrubescens]